MFYFLLLLISTASHALEYDSKFTTLLRSYPSATYISGTLGTSYSLWDRRDNAKHLYGFARTSIYGQSSLVVNSYKAQIDLYPISIFGIYSGIGSTQKNYSKLPTFDCSKVDCNGITDKKYFGSRWGLKWKNFFATGDHKREWLTSNNTKSLFAEEQSSLIGSGEKDELTQHLLYSGIELNESFGIGPLFLFSNIKDLSQESSMSTLTLRYNAKQWTLLFGSGIFHSRDENNHFTIWGLLGFDGAKGLLIF